MYIYNINIYIYIDTRPCYCHGATGICSPKLDHLRTGSHLALLSLRCVALHPQHTALGSTGISSCTIIITTTIITIIIIIITP